MSDLSVGGTVWYRSQSRGIEPGEWRPVEIIAHTSRSWVVRLPGRIERKLPKKGEWPRCFVRTKEEADEIMRLEAVARHNRALIRNIDYKICFDKLASSAFADSVNVKLRELAAIVGCAMPSEDRRTTREEMGRPDERI